MTTNEWYKEFPGAVTVCDREGIILEMNDQSAKLFADDGGRALIGKSVYDCHPETARKKLAALIDQQTVNVYTIEKKGVKKLIYQAPWYQDGVYAGFVELALEIPFELRHFKRG
jgi:transcriptional regulator with PAS, ATPase and Fis domain